VIQIQHCGIAQEPTEISGSSSVSPKLPPKIRKSESGLRSVGEKKLLS